MIKKWLFLFPLSLLLVSNVWAQPTAGEQYVSSLLGKNPKKFAYTKGGFSVNEFGAATYEFPINCVPGAAGITPKISLLYNSSGTSGIMGEGWQLGGFSQITRTGSIYAIDSFYKGIDFTTADRLNLDGQRLMSLSDEYWPNTNNVTEYRTEINTQKRVRGFDENDNNEVERFESFTKDGLIYYYGGLPNETRTSYLMDASRNSIISWLLVRIEDRNGNYIDFDYDQQALTTEFSIRPKTIRYTGFRGQNPLAPFATIEFTYRNETEVPLTKYINGTKFSTKKYLSEIKCTYKPTGSQTEVVYRYYRLEYNNGRNDPRRRYLKKIRECSKVYTVAANADCMDIELEWLQEQETAIFEEQQTLRKQDTLTEAYEVYPGDYNSDGFPDLSYIDDSGDSARVMLYLNDHTGKFNAAGHHAIFKVRAGASRIITADFNADGYTDISFNWLDGHRWKSKIVYIKASIESVTNMILSDTLLDIADVPFTDLKELLISAGDFNGDGFADLLGYYYDDNNLLLQFVIKKAHSWTIPTSPIPVVRNQTLPDNTTVQVPKGTGLLFSDLNGDGANDLLLSWTTDKGWFYKSILSQSGLHFKIGSIAISTSIPEEAMVGDLRSADCNAAGDSCKLTFNAVSVRNLGGEIFSSLRGGQLVDINNDGLSDLILSGTGKDGWQTFVALSKGDGNFERPEPTTITTEVFPYYIAPNFGDFNGDGLLDAVLQKSDQNGWFSLTAYGNGRGKFLLKGQSWRRIDSTSFSYKIAIPQNGVFCFQDFLYRIKWQGSRAKEFIEKFSRTQERIPDATWANDNLLVPFLTNYIQKYNYIETPEFPKTQPGFYDGHLGRSCQSPLRLSEVNFQNNPKMLGEGTPLPSSPLDSVQYRILSNPPQYLRFAKFLVFPAINYWRPLVMDINGDGVSDLLLTYPRQPEDTLSTASHPLAGNLFIKTSINKTPKSGFVAAITHGNKSVVKIRYGSLLDPDHYRQTKDYPYPFVKANIPLIVVRATQTSNGIGNGLNTVQYKYSNGVFSLNGRGFLGFEANAIENVVKAEVVARTFDQSPIFLRLGYAPLRKAERWVNNIRYSSTLHENAVLIFHDGQVKQIVAEKTIDSTFESDKGLSTTNQIARRYDYFGNTVAITTTYGNGLQEILTNTYFEEEDGQNHYYSEWLIGRLKSSHYKREQNGVRLERISRFTYYESNGLLLTENAFANSNRFHTVREYTHDKRGNITQTAYFDIRKPERKINTYWRFDPMGRFVREKEDQLGYKETYETNPLLGINSLTIDIDQNRTTVSLKQRPTDVDDLFGRYRKVTFPTGLTNSEEKRRCDDCPIANAVYFSLAYSSASRHPTISYYDRLDRMVRKESFDQKARRIIEDYSYDDKGNLAATTLPYFHTDPPVKILRYAYDDLDRRMMTMFPGGEKEIIKRGYNCDTVINRKGQSVIKLKDIMGRVVTVIDAQQGRTTFTYDLAGNVAAITDPNNNTFSYKYNELNKKVESRNPYQQHPARYSYTAFGETDTTWLGRNNMTIYAYDELGRPISKSEKRSTQNETEDNIRWEYIGSAEQLSGKGKPKRMLVTGDDRIFNEDYSYDRYGRLTAKLYRPNLEDYNELGISRGPLNKRLEFKYYYNAQNNLLDSIAYPQGLSNFFNKKVVVHYQYVDATLTEAFVNKKSVWQLQETDAAGHITKLNHFAYLPQQLQLSSAYTYNSQTDNLEQIEHLRRQNVVQKFQYTFDEERNVTSRVSGGNREEFLYDNLNRLTGVVYRGDTALFKYDAIGRLTAGDAAKQYWYDADRLVVRDKNNRTVTYGLDEDGNRVSRNSTGTGHTNFNIEYNHLGLPRELRYNSSNGGRKVAFRYDGQDGYSIESNDGNDNATIKFEDLMQLEIHTNYQTNILGNWEITGFSLKQKFFIKVGSETVGYVTESGEQHRESIMIFKKDALNSITLVCDEAGHDYAYSYDVWGRRRESLDWSKNFIGDPHRELRQKKSFTGHEFWDQFGLINMQGRLYDPLTCQMMMPDPVVNIYLPTQGLYLYAYVQNNPATYVDPTGHFRISLRGVVRAFLGSPVFGSLSPIASNMPGIRNFIDKNAGTIAQIEISIAMMALGAPPPIAGFAAGFGSSFSSVYLNGGSFGQAVEAGLQSGTISAVTASFSYAIGTAFDGNTVGKALAHGTFQGLMNEAQGGSFTTGFLAGSISSLGDPVYDKIGGAGLEARIQRTLVAATLGGTVAVISGDKFGNGAWTAAVVHMYNYELHYVHAVLDVIGMVDPTQISDGVNALLYTAEGDYANAAISLGAMVPFIGTTAPAIRVAKNAVSTQTALRAGSRWLGKGYHMAEPGRYVSKDGLRQFRIKDGDILGRPPHVHFETLKGHPMGHDNLHVILKDKGGPLP